MRNQMNIVFCTDFSTNADHAFKEATFMAKATDGHLYVLHVIPGLYTASEHMTPGMAGPQHPDAPKALEQIKSRYISTTDADAEAVIRHGNETAEIMKFSDSVKADLIVIGARGVGALASFFGGGGIADRILKNAKIPVLVVPPA